MKLQEIKDVEDDDFPTTPLKDLSKHIHHGRIWIRDRDADAALAATDAAMEGNDGDITMWHDWLQDTVYEISIAGTNIVAVKKFLKDIQKAVPDAHLAVASKRGQINFTDWTDL